MAKQCKACGGPVGLLGILGSMAHYMCRNCGMMFHRRRKARKEKSK